MVAGFVHFSPVCMGFYLRKSISVGPFRFNLSGSGIGVSAGIKGFRVGTGPRGNYVHMGRGGIYYRKTLSPARPQRHSMEGSDTWAQDPDPSIRGVGPMVEIESGSVSAMTDSSSAELLQELDEKKRKVRLGPAIAVLAVILEVVLFAQQVVTIFQIAFAIVAAIAIFLAFRRDVLTKTVVLFYGFDPALERAYGDLHEAAAKLASCCGHWHVAASARVYDRKYHAGASELLDRKSTAIRKSAPPFLKTNIETVSIGVGRQTMYLFPDRVLVYESGKVGAVGYEQLRVDVSQTKFIENSTLPDARVVDQTWRFVNKKGGPDRRFSNNRMLPICLYDELHFTSSSGLNEVIQVSRSGIGQFFQTAVSGLKRALEEAVSQKPLQQPAATYRIGRNGEDLGELSVAKIKQMLTANELTLQDYYFDFAQNAWVTLDGIEALRGST